MKNKLRLFYIVPILCLAVPVFFFCVKSIEKHEIAQKKKNVAATMGVSLTQYPYFPMGYLSKTLKEGMTLEQVHKIMIGYEKVVHASWDPGYSETYCYFSTDDDTATHIQILYDANFVVERIITEDENSRTILAEGRPEGLLER